MTSLRHPFAGMRSSCRSTHCTTRSVAMPTTIIYEPLTFDPYIPLALWVPLALAAAGLLAAYAAGKPRPDAGPKARGDSRPDGPGRGRAAGRLAQSNLDGPRAASAGQAAALGAGRRLGQHGRPRCPAAAVPLPGGLPDCQGHGQGPGRSLRSPPAELRRRIRRPPESRPWRPSGPTERRPTWPRPSTRPWTANNPRGRPCCC